MKYCECFRCKKDIYYIQNRKGQMIPIDKDSKNYHWDTCEKNTNVFTKTKQQLIIKGVL